MSGIALDDDLPAVDRNGWRVHLTRREFEILSLLYKSKGRPVTMRQMIENMYDTEADEATPGAIGAYIYRLRRKIEAIGIRVENHGQGRFTFAVVAMPDLT